MYTLERQLLTTIAESSTCDPAADFASHLEWLERPERRATVHHHLHLPGHQAKVYWRPDDQAVAPSHPIENLGHIVVELTLACLCALPAPYTRVYILASQRYVAGANIVFFEVVKGVSDGMRSVAALIWATRDSQNIHTLVS
jgi:hypothetical protein